jgi:hypothetical protein
MCCLSMWEVEVWFGRLTKSIRPFFFFLGKKIEIKMTWFWTLEHLFNSKNQPILAHKDNLGPI